ncbi:hypothetical protein [Halomicronema sp. CCY15110]|uniref:hypothetical protein n=1 Tax=Halomicronema sp. CCY15110 TaxID=2767773 RepID=UPI00195251F2|nr:hypothetical protein [Halomicronema sp. CCY15110]
MATSINAIARRHPLNRSLPGWDEGTADQALNFYGVLDQTTPELPDASIGHLTNHSPGQFPPGWRFHTFPIWQREC